MRYSIIGRTIIGFVVSHEQLPSDAVALADKSTDGGKRCTIVLSARQDRHRNIGISTLKFKTNPCEDIPALIPELALLAPAGNYRHTRNGPRICERVYVPRRSRAYTYGRLHGKLPHDAPQIPGFSTSTARRGCGCRTHSNPWAFPT